MRASRVLALLVACLLVTGCGAEDGEGGGEHRAPETGRDVLAAMVDAHAGSRYRTLTFVQRTLSYGPEGTPTDTSTWYEALAPNRLRIDVAPWEEGNGILYRDGIRYTIRGGEVADSAADLNPLAIVLADAFHQPLDRTETELDSLGFDLSVVRAADRDGEPVWVVGAGAGDSTSSQLWVERERMLPVRIIHRLPSGPVMDARIGGYERVDGSWVESRIAIYVGGRLAQDELYRQIRVNPELPEGLFDPYTWSVEEPYWR